MADVCEICFSPFEFVSRSTTLHHTVPDVSWGRSNAPLDESTESRSSSSTVECLAQYHVIIIMRVLLALVAASMVPLLLVACPDTRTLFTECMQQSAVFVILWTATASFFVFGCIVQIMIYFTVRASAQSSF
jgi:hypothetical protein